MANGATLTMATPGHRACRWRYRTRIQLLLALALAVFGVWTTASFARSAAGAQSAPARLRLLRSGVQLPAGVRTLRYSAIAPDGRLRWRAPNWHVSPDESAAVTTAGDLALVDAEGAASVTVTLYVTNLPALGYRSFALPVAVWESDRPATRASWHAAPVMASFLSDIRGRVSFTLPGGRFYDITIERGGCLIALPGRGDYSPEFYATLS